VLPAAAVSGGAVAGGSRCSRSAPGRCRRFSG
jgi:hypothetical protein